MNESGEKDDPDILDSFFRPGGILAGILNDDDDKDEDGAEKKQNTTTSNPFGGGVQQPQQNPWGTSLQPWRNPLGSSIRSASRGEPPLVVAPTLPPNREQPMLVGSTGIPPDRQYSGGLRSLNDPASIVDEVGGEEIPMMMNRIGLRPPSIAPIQQQQPSSIYHAGQQQSYYNSAPTAARQFNQREGYFEAQPLPQSYVEQAQPQSYIAAATQKNTEATTQQRQSMYNSIPAAVQQQQHNEFPPGFSRQSSVGAHTDKAHVQIAEEETDQESTRSNSSVPHDVYNDEDKSMDVVSVTSSLSTSTYGQMIDSSVSGSHYNMDDDRQQTNYDRISEHTEDDSEPEFQEPPRRRTVKERMESKRRAEREKQHRESSLSRKSSVETNQAQAPPPHHHAKRKKSKQRHGSPKRERPEAKTTDKTKAASSSSRDKSSSGAATTAQANEQEGPSPLEVMTEAGKLLLEAIKLLLQLIVSIVPSIYRLVRSIFTGIHLSWPAVQKRLLSMGYAVVVVISASMSVIRLTFTSAWLEITTEWTTAICFLVLYWLPIPVGLITTTFLVPHYAPQFICGAVLYLLFWPDESSRKHKQRTVRRRQNSYICQKLLWVGRNSIPAFILLDGFDYEKGAIFGMKTSWRIVFAYVLAAVRQDLGLSPLIWLGAAVLTMIGLHQSASPLFVSDFLFTCLALAWIRLARFFEREASKVS